MSLSARQTMLQRCILSPRQLLLTNYIRPALLTGGTGTQPCSGGGATTVVQINTLILAKTGNYPERKLDGDVRRRHSGKEMEAEEMLGVGRWNSFPNICNPRHAHQSEPSSCLTSNSTLQSNFFRSSLFDVVYLNPSTSFSNLLLCHPHRHPAA
jgi:hypothetical protein